MPLRLAPLERARRAEVRGILERSGAFAADEVAVALELFDDAFPASDAAGPTKSPASTDEPGAAGEAPAPEVDYEFVGVYDEAGGDLRGYACWGATPGAERTFDLYWIAVDPGAQGAGGGTLLLAEVERRLAGRRARMLVVETSSRPEYEGARGFYARRGYREAARVREFYAPGDDRIILTKRIEQRGS